MVATGTNASGTAVFHCNDWSTIFAQVTTGSSAAGPDTWTFTSVPNCGPRQLYCFMNTKVTPLVLTPAAGKRIYVSSAPFVPGADPDVHCESDKPVGTGTVEALVARTTGAAATHLDPGTVYVRPDGQVVGTGQQLIDVSEGVGLLDTGMWQTAAGTYGTRFVWVGAADLTTVPLTSSNCANWTVTTGNGRVGLSNATGAAFSSDGTSACTHASTHLYCVEQ